ncbi:hypothetical protein EDC01DRAFT_429778 [Geopyxis carbonaria]|nr:hypothetical protein EDC01DRAFT_429778 [Geopyxis carbonaria]
MSTTSKYPPGQDSAGDINTKIVVAGPPFNPNPNEPLPVRMEIHDLLKDAELKNLYILGMEEMQTMDWKDRLSWYQLAGIHGGPYEAWDRETDKSGERRGRYCTHSSKLFISWHRAYLAVFEQALHKCIQNVLVSKKYPVSVERMKVLKPLADNFRMPYWDWAKYPFIPAEFKQKTIKVIRGNGVEEELPLNPLFSYKHPDRPEPQHPKDGHPDGWGTLERFEPMSAQTSRADGNLQNVLAIGNTRDSKHYGANLNVRDRTFILLSLEQYQGETFASFSTNRWTPNGVSSDYDSLEAIHDWLHGAVGGDMGSVAHAAFDPIFMLHHTNVDRLGALWQALHPKLAKSWETFEGDSSTFWTEGTKESPTTPLIPFRRAKEEYWNTIDTRDFTRFGYTYPELTGWKSNQTEQEAKSLRNSVATKVRKLYGPAQISLAKSAPQPTEKFLQKIVETSPEVAELSVSGIPVEAIASLVSPIVTAPQPIIIPQPLLELAETPTHSEYFTNLRAPKHAFGGSFVVHVFLGAITTDSASRASDPNLVGSWAVFATDVKSTGGCANCNDQAAESTAVTGSVPLTGALLERGWYGNDQLTEGYLKDNLNWSFHNGPNLAEELALDRLEGMLKVFVTKAQVTKPTDETGLPVYTDWNPVPEITEQKTTGTGPSDTEGYST